MDQISRIKEKQDPSSASAKKSIIKIEISSQSPQTMVQHPDDSSLGSLQGLETTEKAAAAKEEHSRVVEHHEEDPSFTQNRSFLNISPQINPLCTSESYFMAHRFGNQSSEEDPHHHNYGPRQEDALKDSASFMPRQPRRI